VEQDNSNHANDKSQRYSGNQNNKFPSTQSVIAGCRDTRNDKFSLKKKKYKRRARKRKFGRRFQRTDEEKKRKEKPSEHC
jgi:hypothetical protein